MRRVGAALVIIASLGCAGSLDPAFTGAIALTIGQASRARAVDVQPSGKPAATDEEGRAKDGDTSDE